MRAAARMSRCLVLTAVLTSVMTASARVSEESNGGWVSGTRANASDAAPHMGQQHFSCVDSNVCSFRCALKPKPLNVETAGIFRLTAFAALERRAVSKLAAFHYVTSSYSYEGGNC